MESRPRKHPGIYRGRVGQIVEDHVGTGKSVEDVHRQAGTGTGAVGDQHLVGIGPDERGEQALHPAVLLVEPVVAVVGIVCDLVHELRNGGPGGDRGGRQAPAEQVGPLGEHRKELPDLLLDHARTAIHLLYVSGRSVASGRSSSVTVSTRPVPDRHPMDLVTTGIVSGTPASHSPCSVIMLSMTNGTDWLDEIGTEKYEWTRLGPASLETMLRPGLPCWIMLESVGDHPVLYVAIGTNYTVNYWQWATLDRQTSEPLPKTVAIDHLWRIIDVAMTTSKKQNRTRTAERMILVDTIPVRSPSDAAHRAATYVLASHNDLGNLESRCN